MPNPPRDKESVWRVQLLRLTAFTSKSYGAEASKWWDTVSGEPPESRTERLKDSIISIEGRLGAGKLSLSLTPGRIDWVVGAEMNMEQPLSEMPNIGLLGDVFSSFQVRCKKFLSLELGLTRVALGAILMVPVPDRQTGYGMLPNYHPIVQIDPATSQDFLYQINRPVKSRVLADVDINRLQKWAVSMLTPMSLQLVTMLGAPHQLVDLEPSVNAMRLELDISTSATRKEDLPSDRLDAFFEEMVELAVAIAQSGDRP